LRGREAAPAIRALRDRAEAVRAAETERALRRLPHLAATDRAAVEALTRQLVAKLLHTPTVRLKEGAADRLPVGAAARYLFGLDADDERSTKEAAGEAWARRGAGAATDPPTLRAMTPRAALPLIAAIVAATAACGPRLQERATIEYRPGMATPESEAWYPGKSFPADPREPRLRNLRMLTNGGENAEAYFSADGRELIFQSTRDGHACDQQYIMDVNGRNVRRVSNGLGRTTCGYIFPAGDRILFSSTHEVAAACPAPPDMSQGYVWKLYDYDIFVANKDGSGLRNLTGRAGYDAEATISPDGSRIIFTSDRDGDLDLYIMDADGSNVVRLTDEPGYDGGAFFSADGSRIVWRASRPRTEAELASFRALLAERKIRPGVLEIFVMDADGSNKRQVTNFSAASFAPFFHPSGEKIIFSSNLHDPRGRNFDLYLINSDGTDLERVTHFEDFDGFPMFSPDGRQLVFASNRGQALPGETNVFIADWVEDLHSASPAAPGLGFSPAPQARRALSQDAACPAPFTEYAQPFAAIRYLADDALEGRAAGSAGERCGGDYIAREFDRIGLTPAGVDGTWFQDIRLASVANPHAEGGTGRNVLALLEGSDPELRHQVVVIGAHYDHLGWGGFGSMSPNERAIHNGADDNASGVGALLAAAERLAAGARPRRSVLFIAFSGEELGLLGSAQYVASPTVPLAEKVAMLNMDMVGRLETDPLIVHGTGTAEEWDVILRAANRDGIALQYQPSGYGPSDHTSFYARDIPVLHFFTNVHADYHRPSDDWEKIDTTGVRQIAELVVRVTAQIADAPARLALVRGAGEPPQPARGGGHGAWLGSVPDFSPVDFGVRLSGVSADSPAEAAGLRAGDIIIRIDDVDIKDLYALTDVLRERRPGERVLVVYVRDGQEQQAEVVLGRRGG
jgi:Tol biopolymer transport system component